MKIVRLTTAGLLATLLIIGGMYLGPFWRIGSERTVRDYHLMMYANPAMWNLTWLGIPVDQNPNDVWIIQEIIEEVKPDLIVETGTARGGSAAIWAMIQGFANPEGRLISIDIKDRLDRENFPLELRQRIDFWLGSSVDPSLVARVYERAQGRKTMVILDSNHHKDHVLKELNSYAPMVSIGSYLIVQDTNISGYPIPLRDYRGDGPMEAVEKFLPNHGEFQVDKSREKLLFTMHPSGYLRRTS
jgi:cephalosporin hydroxylase